MHMETLNCGYPIAPLMGSASMSPPMTPTSEVQYASDCSSRLFAETQYARHSYSSSPLQNTGDFATKYDADDANNNNNIYGDDTTSNDLYDSSVLNGLSNLSISEEDELSFGDPLTPSSSPPSSIASRPRSKKNSRSKSKISTSSTCSSMSTSSDTSRSRAKTSTSSTCSSASSSATCPSASSSADHSRKDSFVYDVRLTDEQFLFFVPDLDLVKSHLMFAVREEVDVLKEKIVELMDRINHLECENSLLRQYASPDVIQQLQTQLPHQMQQQPPHHSSTT